MPGIIQCKAPDKDVPSGWKNVINEATSWLERAHPNLIGWCPDYRSRLEVYTFLSRRKTVENQQTKELY